MSTSSPFPVSDDILQEFKNSTEGSSNVSFFQIQVKDEKFILVSQQCGTGDIQADFNNFCSGASNNQASFFLYRGNNRKEWTFVTFVPEVPIKERMVYASAKGTLKDKLGHNNFVKELHFTTTSELTYSSVKESERVIDTRSDFEKVHEKVLKDEDEARNEAEKQHTASSKASGIGGYHTVSIPLSSAAITELDKIKSGSANWVQLMIDDSKENVVAESAKTISNADLKREIIMNEPRFYIYAKTPNNYVFIYCCPEKSPPKLRMVYSTSKPSMIDQIVKKGFTLAKKAEITDSNEIDEALSAPAPRANFGASNAAPKQYGAPRGGLQEGGGQSKAYRQSVIHGANPLAQMMMNNGTATEGATTKKKIVIPPANAW